jgi:hypothetical protein
MTAKDCKLDTSTVQKLKRTMLDAGGGGPIKTALSVFQRRKDHPIVGSHSDEQEVRMNIASPLVTFLYPPRLASEARWRVGVRLS